MNSSNYVKMKILHLAKLFQEKTDDEHSLTTDEICSYMEAAGYSMGRKAVPEDVEVLNAFGMDIICEKKGKNNTYHLVSGLFEPVELKLLVQAVEASKFITEKKSGELIGKLEKLTSEYTAKTLNRDVAVTGRAKTLNEGIFYNVDKIVRGISENRKIQFIYFKLNREKKEEFQHNGKVYEISPWHLLWDNEKYYMIGYDAEAGKLKHYRVDKMKKIAVTDLPREGEEQFSEIDLSTYTQNVFGMFGGKIVKVKLLCENWVADVLADRFGTDFPVDIVDEEHFTTEVDVAVSKQFYGWIVGLDGGVKILEPAEALKEFNETIGSFKNKKIFKKIKKNIPPINEAKNR